MKYFGRWNSYDSMFEDFNGWNEAYKVVDKPTERQILFASYGGGSYEGDAFVLYKKGKKLYEVNGSHCSCYGLEGQWKPEETSWASLVMRGKQEGSRYGYFLSEHEQPAIDAYWKLVEANNA